MRIRTIKPDFFHHDGIAELSPIARLLFIGLWCMADRRGRLEDRPKRIKASLLPYDADNVDELLQSLNDFGFIVRYSVGGRKLIQIPAFDKHQRITGKESERESDFPAPTEPNSPTIIGETNGKQTGNTGEASETTEGRKEGRKEVEEKEREMAPSAGFPKTEQQAKSAAFQAGCPEEFAVKVWNLAMGRGGVDAKGNPIRSWAHHLKASWSMDQNRVAEHPGRSPRQAPRNNLNI